MKIGFVVNPLSESQPLFAWPDLSFTAHKAGHEVYIIELGDLINAPDGTISAMAYKASDKKFRSVDAFRHSITEEAGKDEIGATELDILMLRYDSGSESGIWAQEAVISFAKMAVKQQVLVLNEPATLMNSIHKMYIQEFPQQVRVETLVSRNTQKIREYYKYRNEEMVLKPLLDTPQGDIFLLKKNATNLNQMVDAIARDGYVLAQQYLDTQKRGKVKLLMMNGEPVFCNGKVCAVKFHEKENQQEPVKDKELNEVLNAAKLCGPRLKKDGIFLAELEFVGDKLMSVNTMNTSVIHAASGIYGEAFASEVISALEDKMKFKGIYGSHLTNSQLAVYS